MDKKSYQMPEDIVGMWEYYWTRENIIDRLIRIPFCLNKAINLRFENKRLHDKIWKKIYEIYPELKGKSLSCNHEDKLIYLEEKEIANG